MTVFIGGSLKLEDATPRADAAPKWREAKHTVLAKGWGKRERQGLIRSYTADGASPGSIAHTGTASMPSANAKRCKPGPTYASNIIPAPRTAALSKVTMCEQPWACAVCAISTSTKT